MRKYKIEGIITDGFEDEEEISTQDLMEKTNESGLEWLVDNGFEFKLTNLLRINNETSSNSTQSINNESTDSTTK